MILRLQRKVAKPKRPPAWVKKAEEAGEITTGVWYRSPLWSDDHLLQEDGVAWCGRSLSGAAKYNDPILGGLYVSERKGAKCSQCRSHE